MPQLAQRLNDLAVANSNGLLNDDEYRLLRQNAFEEHSANAVIPTEVPLVPITACLDVHVRVQTTIPELPDTPRPTIYPPVRSKVTVSAGVANLLSKASGRRTPKLVRDPPLTPRDGRKPSRTGHDSPSGSLKLSVMIPKLLYKKPSDPRSTETPRPLADALNASHAKGHFKLPPISIPTPRRNLARSSATNPDKSTTSLRLDVPREPSSSLSSAPSIRVGDEDIGIFSEDSLSSSSAIRSTIAATEEELRTLIDAFQTLETRTCRRIQKQNAHRLPTNTPASVDILLEGREWREHRLVPLLSPSSSHLLDSASHRHLFPSPTTDSPTSDGTSVHSASSHNTNLSRARSISSLSRISHSKSAPGPVSTGSPLSTGLVRLPPKKHLTLPRKSSISSTTSSLLSKSCNSHPSHTHDMSLRPAGLQAENNNLSTSGFSQSKSHLRLKKLKGSSRMFSQETLMSYSTCTSSEEGPGGHAGSGNSGCGGGNTRNENDPELVDVRKRREELVARYNARLEFLRAKLKGAELHERLLRR